MGMASEIRQDKTSGRWVIIAPTRGKRPSDFRRHKEGRESQPIHDPRCPFCAGNEQTLPGIIMESSLPGQTGWQTRVVPNKYPALTPEADASRYRRGIYLAMPGYGRHEVIIESPLHNQDLATMSPAAVATVIETYHRRYVEVMKERNNLMAIVFRNHGIRAGTSLLHPHSQLMVTGIVPQWVRWRENEAQDYFDEWGRCVYCDILAFEARDRQRVILENTSFLAFVPFAAEVPFEVWLVPKRHQADFGRISDEEKKDLTSALRDILARLCRKLDNPDYNYMINTSTRHQTEQPQLHWFLQLQPRLTTQAGFEIRTGMHINPSVPEEDAAYLNEASPHAPAAAEGLDTETFS